MDAGGRIVALGPDAAVPRPPGVPEGKFQSVALLPGLVNAHTHLELTGFDGLVPEDDFPTWVGRVRALKESRTRAEYLTAARRGLAECHAAGVTTIADTGDSGAVIEALHEAGGSGVAYQEVFGPHPDEAETRLAGLRGRVKELGRFVSPRIRLGISPHAPYTVSGPLFAAVARWVHREGFPLAVHLAESADEVRLLAGHGGGFADGWRRRGIPLPPPPGGTPVEWLDRHGVLGRTTLCIHLVQAGAGDVERLRERGCAVAHCPRSNRRHRHGDAPLDRFLRAGLPVGVGTDSVASVAPLDLVAEARAARALAGLRAAAALRLITADAASALGLGGDVGVLRAGAWGDFALIALPDAVAGEEVEEAVLAAGTPSVIATVLAGRTVFRRAA